MKKIFNKKDLKQFQVIPIWKKNARKFREASYLPGIHDKKYKESQIVKKCL